MSEKRSRLMQRRGELLERITVQRDQVSEIASQLRTPLALADWGVAAIRFLRSHPLLMAGAAASIAIRRRGVAGLLRGMWLLWK